MPGEPSSCSEPHPGHGPAAPELPSPQPASRSGRAQGPRSPVSPRLGVTEAADFISVSYKINPKKGVGRFPVSWGLGVSSLMQLSGRRGVPDVRHQTVDRAREERCPSEAAASGWALWVPECSVWGQAAFPDTSGCPDSWVDHARCPGLLVSALESPRGRTGPSVTSPGALRTCTSLLSLAPISRRGGDTPG